MLRATPAAQRALPARAQLEDAYAAAVTVVRALHAQNADADRDFARTLDAAVVLPLWHLLSTAWGTSEDRDRDGADALAQLARKRGAETEDRRTRRP